MIGTLVRDIRTGVIGIVVDTYIFMNYKNEQGEQILERDYYVKWNDGENFWISHSKVDILSESSS